MARKRRKSKAELEAELRYVRRGTVANRVGSIVNNLIRIGGLVLIARYGYLTVQALAGAHTVADIGIGVRLLGEVKVQVAVAWIGGLGGVFYGIGQRRLRRETIGRLQGRIRTLEAAVDPGRTSSHLTVTGETNPEDL